MPETPTAETRRDRILRVATAYAIATGVRGISKRTRESKNPLGNFIRPGFDLNYPVRELVENGRAEICLDDLAGEREDVESYTLPASKSWLYMMREDGKFFFYVSNRKKGRRGRTNKQLIRTELFHAGKKHAGSMSISDLESRVDGLVENDPFFGKAVLHKDDGVVLLEAIDARTRSQGVYNSRLANFGKKVAKSPHTYQALAGLGLAALFSTQGPEFANWWNTWIQHGFGKWLYDLMSDQRPLKVFESSGLKVMASWILGGGLARAAAYSAKLPEYFRQEREKKGVVRALAASSVYVPGKVLNYKAVAGDALTGAFVSVLFPFVFGVMLKAGELTSKLVDAGSTLVSGHPFTNTVIYDPKFSLPVKQTNGDIIQVPFKYTVDAFVKSWWICFGPAFSGKKLLFPAKHAFQRYMEDSGGPFRTLYRPFVEAGKSFGRLRTAMGSEGASLGVAGRHLLGERDRFTAYMADLWTRSYNDPKTREGVLRGDGTLKSYWAPTVHSTTGALPGPYVVPWSAAVAWTMPFWLSLYGIISGGKPKDIYQDRVSPRSYQVMTGKATA